jgi:hypothetical protein
MTDDIVTRLRNWHDQRDSWQTLTEAADEIERLRAVIQWFEHTQTCPNYGVRNCWRCVTPANQKSILEAMFD